MILGPDETLITGAWNMLGGQMVPDAGMRRIQRLVRDRLEHVKDAAGGQQMLYRDPTDGRYWERTVPYSALPGSGPETLRALGAQVLQVRYGITIEE